MHSSAASESSEKAASAQLDQEARSQALAQEQAVFNRKMDDHGALFKLQLAMGWATFLMIPTTVIASFVYPPAAVGMVPLTGLAAWNWRRMLRRGEADIEVMTRSSDSPQ